MPGAVLAAWYTSWWWYPTLVLVLVFTLLVFPTGRLLSARWRPVALVAGAGTAVIVTLSALQPTLEDEDSLVRNPIGLAGVPDPGAGHAWRRPVRAAVGLARRPSRWWCGFAARVGWSASSSSGSPTPPR